MYNYESRPGSDDAQGYDASPVEYIPFGASPSHIAHDDYSDSVSSEPVEDAPTHEIAAPQPRPSSSPTPRKGRNRWVVAGIAVALLLVGLASFAIVSYLNRSTPARTLDTFCSALQRQDYQTAYNQMSPQLQAQLPENVLATALSQDRVVSCTHGTANETGGSTTTSLMLRHESKGINNDFVKLVLEQDNSWKIDDLQKA